MCWSTLLPFGRISPYLLVPLLLASPVHGQTAGDKGPASSTTTVLKNVDDVSIDFVVRKKNKPVLDLKPEDVVITDERSTVRLSDLRLVTGQSGADHLITFLFDPLDPSAGTNARDVAKKILKLIPLKGFSFSVFNTDGRLRLLQAFTPDRESIQTAVSVATSDNDSKRNEAAVAAEKKLISAVQSGLGKTQAQTSAFDPTLQQAMLASITDSQRIMQNQRTHASLAGLLALVRAQTNIPGRKLLVYFTEGVQPDLDARDTLRSIASAANRAAVSIYVINKSAVDPKLMDGLLASQAMGALAAFNRFNPAPTGPAAQTPTAFSGGMISQVADQITRIEGEGLAGNTDPLAGMAVSTGGASIFSEDNLKKPFRQALADLTTYYEASYVRPGAEYDGKFHQVTVKTLRRGLKVQSRAGYFAVPPVTGVRGFEAPLLKLLSEPQLPADVKFRVAILQLGNLMTGNENTLVVEVPISGLEVRSDPNTNLSSSHVSIVSQVKDKSGNVVEQFSDDLRGYGALDAKEQSGYTTMQRHFALAPGEYTLETAVIDRNSGKTAGQRTPFEVATVASGPFIGDIAVVGRIDPFSEEMDPLEPLRYKEGKIIPSLAGQVSPDTKAVSFFFLVHADSSMSDPAMLELQLLRNGQHFGQIPLQLPKNIEEAFPYLASLNTSSLPAGNYSVIASLTQGGKIMERQAGFVIAGPQLANAELGRTRPAEPSKEAAELADSTEGGSEILTMRRQPLVITSLPPHSVVPPTDSELDEIIAGARKNALNYAVKLPNFLCVEITDRSVDSSGKGIWRSRDSFGELLRYVDNQETRTTLEVNGRPSTTKRADMDGPISLGEFGHLLSLVFQPSSKAEFHWKETNALANGRVQVLEYRVDRKNENMVLSDSSGKVGSGFHGLAYIDAATMGVRRITMEADDVPPGFSIHAASIAVDYDYVSIGAHDYLMPMRAMIRVQRGRHEVNLNQIVFQNYRRYASRTKIISAP